MSEAPGRAELVELLNAIRKEAGASTWGRGVQLARDGKVVLESAAPDEWEFRVPRERGILTWSISVYPEDLEWCCDCPSRRDTCEHVCAAIIKAQQTKDPDGEDRAGDAGLGRIHYGFHRAGHTLTLTRSIVRDGELEVLALPLAQLAKEPGALKDVLVLERDLDVELILEHRVEGRLSRARIPALFKALASCKNISLDGAPVAVKPSRAQPRIVVEAATGGYLLRLQGAGSIDEVFENGAIRSGATLSPLGDGGLSREETRLYSKGRFFPASEAGRLMMDTVPHLESCLEVEWAGLAQPAVDNSPPRVVFTTSRMADELVVLADVVYGEPVRGKICGDDMEILGAPIPIRDENEEGRLSRELLRELGLKPGVEARLRGVEALQLADRLRGFGGSVTGSGLDRFFMAAPVIPRLSIGEEDFRLRFESSDGVADAAQVFRAWQNGDPLVSLRDGGLAPLPADWLERCGQLAADLLEAREATGKLPRACVLDLAKLWEADGGDPAQVSESLRRLVENFRAVPEATLPSDLTADLRGYQTRGVNWLAFLKSVGFGALLADDMGLGKTVQALAIVESGTLVVAPTSVVKNWEREAARFRPGLKVSTYHGPNRKLEEADVILTTYAVLRIDREKLAARPWKMVILDEAQVIKNSASQVAQAAFSLEAQFRLALTGTPIENRLEELWSQFHFLNPGLLGRREDFRARYAKPMESGDSAAAEALRQRLKPFVLRRLKREVAPELPPRTELVLYAHLGDEERELYDTLRLAAQTEVKKILGAGGGVLRALEALLRLRQAACHPALVPGQKGERSAKLDLLGETLDKTCAEDHKALVFSQWTSLLDLVEGELDRRGIDFVRLDGSTRDRAAVTDAFQAIDGPPVFLLSLKAGGTGLNLTAADHVFILDPWWNPATEAQAADRAHRIGQERPVMIHRLIAADTVEERILALQASKRELASQALAGAGHGGGLSRDDLVALLD